MAVITKNHIAGYSMDACCDECGKKLSNNRIFHHQRTICPACSRALSEKAKKPNALDMLYAAALRRHKLKN